MITRLLTIGLIFCLSASLATAQNNEKGQMSFGILGGVNFQTLSGTDHSGDELDYNMLIGYHAGFRVQIPIAPGFYFQPGLLYTVKGSKNTSGAFTSSTKVNYIELPLNLVYKGKLGNGYIVVGFGPYISYGIGGKVTTTGGEASLDTEVLFQNKVELTDPLTARYFKPIDAGGNIFAGYETDGGLFFQLNTQLGMIKSNPENAWFINDEASVKHTGFGFSLGYRF